MRFFEKVVAFVSHERPKDEEELNVVEDLVDIFTEYGIDRDEFIMDVNELTRGFNYRLRNVTNGHIVFSNLTPYRFTLNLCVVSADIDEVENIYTEYLLKLESMLGLCSVCAESLVEQTEEYFLNAASSASRLGTGDNLDDHTFTSSSPFLNRIIDNHCLYENIIEPMNKKKIIKDVENGPCPNELLKEINNIYDYPSDEHVYGHPVHYIIKSENSINQRDIYEPLINALYANKRIQSKRYVNLTLDFFVSLSGHEIEILYDNLYKSTLVIRISEDSPKETNRISEFQVNLYNLCEQAYIKRNEVLTIFVVPKNCDNILEVIGEKIKNTSFVIINEETFEKDHAIKLCNSYAKENHVRIDNDLKDLIKDNRKYSIAEIKEIYQKWYRKKICNTKFKCYSNLPDLNTEHVKDKASGNAYEGLQEMIGLTEVKEVIDKAICFNRINKVYSKRGIITETPVRHMCFLGNPGTGKTEVARLFAKIMQENKVLEKGHIVEVSRKDLVGKYLGWSAKICAEKVNAARGGILFIDEAYSLVQRDDDSYGHEVLDTLVKLIEDYRDELIVIFAGYSDKMTEFIDENPGLRSRIGFFVNFQDYSTEDLIKISQLIAKKNHLVLDEGVTDKLRPIFDKAKNIKESGNGRLARNVIEQAKMCLAQRLVKSDLDELDNETLTTIKPEDIQFDINSISKHKVTPIGF